MMCFLLAYLIENDISAWCGDLLSGVLGHHSAMQTYQAWGQYISRLGALETHNSSPCGRFMISTRVKSVVTRTPYCWWKYKHQGMWVQSSKIFALFRPSVCQVCTCSHHDSSSLFSLCFLPRSMVCGHDTESTKYGVKTEIDDASWIRAKIH